MRIDDLNRSVQAQETEKSGAVSPDHGKVGGNAQPDSDSDSATISQLATDALDGAANTASNKSHDARIEALRLQVQRGEYNVSAEDVAASIIDQHIAG